MKLYVYKLLELDNLMLFFDTVPPEMDLYDLFISKLKSNYEIVDDIENSDIAFIPIDFIKLIYGQIKNTQWHNFYTELLNAEKYKELTPPSQPPTFGSDIKEKFIKFFWENYVKDFINLKSPVPHFILYSYVLFEISFEPIDKNVHILSYENEVSFFNKIQTYDKGTFNRMVTIPYILNSNPTYSLPKITKNFDVEKKYNISFIGNLYDENRPLLYLTRNFIVNLPFDVKISGSDNLMDTLPKTKYLLVLRGDTPTRVSFYQSFAYKVVPIIFEKELKIYSQVLSDPNLIYESCFILPNKNDLSDEEYLEIVTKILNDELSDNKNYLRKIKNHELIFNQINYFSEECLPVEISLQKIINSYRKYL
jgi:hypothetical protein